MTQRILNKHKKTLKIWAERHRTKVLIRTELIIRKTELEAQIKRLDGEIAGVAQTVQGFKSMIREGRKTVIKPLSPRQWEILQIVRQGYGMYFYADKYRYFKDGLYHEVNKQSVECLMQQGFLRLAGDYALILTNKGVNHKQIEKPCKPR
jgi:hypothetical protein